MHEAPASATSRRPKQIGTPSGLPAYLIHTLGILGRNLRRALSLDTHNRLYTVQPTSHEKPFSIATHQHQLPFPSEWQRLHQTHLSSLSVIAPAPAARKPK